MPKVSEKLSITVINLNSNHITKYSTTAVYKIHLDYSVVSVIGTQHSIHFDKRIEFGTQIICLLNRLKESSNDLMVELR